MAENRKEETKNENWWGERPRAESRASGRGKGRGNSAKANVAQAVNITGATSNDAVGDGEQVALSGLSPTQWSALLNVISTHKTGTSTRLSGPQIKDADWSW
ncbi:hypothetical protein AAC387_Pa07g1674 [Persea americana]